LTKFDVFDKEMETIHTMFVNKTTVEQLMNHVAKEIIDMNNNIAKNMTMIENEVQSLIACKWVGFFCFLL